MKDRLLQVSLFRAKLFRNGSDTKITIDYVKDGVMSIRGLGAELPDYLELAPKGIFMQGKKGLEEVRDTEIEVYRLLDPRFLLKYSEVEVEEMHEMLDGTYEVHAMYNMNKLPLSGDCKGYFEKHNEMIRRICLQIRADTLLSMSQNDIPPLSNSIDLLFFYFKETT